MNRDNKPTDPKDTRAREQEESLKNSDKHGHQHASTSKEGMDPGQDKVAKNSRKGAGQQQSSGGNPAMTK
ncbi:MAG: hypothetical protein ACR2KB_01005 [Chitinophagaceae bacterium]